MVLLGMMIGLVGRPTIGIETERANRIEAEINDALERDRLTPAA
jgi:hypothetical protein